MKKSQALCISLNEHWKNELDQLAEELHFNRSEMIVELIRYYQKQKEAN